MSKMVTVKTLAAALRALLAGGEVVGGGFAGTETATNIRRWALFPSERDVEHARAVLRAFEALPNDALFSATPPVTGDDSGDAASGARGGSVKPALPDQPDALREALERLLFEGQMPMEQYGPSRGDHRFRQKYIEAMNAARAAVATSAAAGEGGER